MGVKVLIETTGDDGSQIHELTEENPLIMKPESLKNTKTLEIRLVSTEQDA